MKSSRLLTMLLLLQSVERRSARELSEALEVSERTVYRDVDALSASGVPIYTERGVNGGIALSPGYRKALTQFGEDEIRALFVSASNPLIDLGLGLDRERALEKLTGAMNDDQRMAVVKTRGRIHLDQRRWNQSAQPQEFLALLRRAVWEDRRVRLHYRDRDAKITERTVEPLGLVAKAGVWYLVAAQDAEFRTFRAERIIDVELLDLTFQRPANFDLDIYWREWTSSIESHGQRFPVVVRVHSEMLELVTRYWETEVISTPSDADADSVVLRINFPVREAALHELIAWGTRVRVLEPLDLCDELITIAHKIIVHYTEGAALAEAAIVLR